MKKDRAGVDIVKFTIPIQPITKKNSQRIAKRGRRNIILPSEAYEQYEKDCGYFIKPPKSPIAEPINVKATYYMGTRRKVDLANLHNALHDVLVKYRVVEDDNSRIIVSTDGSRVDYDKENPRTEVEITYLDTRGDK